MTLHDPLRVALELCLEKCINFIVRKPNEQFAYSRCGYCNLPWWDDKEQHNFGCIIPEARAALASDPMKEQTADVLREVTDAINQASEPVGIEGKSCGNEAQTICERFGCQLEQVSEQRDAAIGEWKKLQASQPRVLGEEKEKP